MDSEYFIRIILEGRDNLGSALASAQAKLKAFKTEAEGVSGSLDKVRVSQDRVSDSTTRATRNESNHISALERKAGALTEQTTLMHTVSRATQQLARDGGVLERGFARLKIGASGFSRALFDTQRGVRDMSFAMRKAQGDFYNFAYNASRNLDNVVKSFTRMNSIAAFLAPLLFGLITAVLNLGAALVSVASAAAMAGAALGGAFVAGIMQAIPVVGLLAAAMHRLGAITNAATLLSKEQTKANLGQVASNRAAGMSAQELGNRKADAILAEKDAALSLLEAKQRLRDLEKGDQQAARRLADLKANVESARARVKDAQDRGNAGETSVALEGLATAEQEYNSATASTGSGGNLEERRAQLSVQQAQQRLKEAREAKARGGLTYAQAAGPAGTVSPAEMALAGLDPSERRLVTVIQNFKRLWQQATRPLTDLIIDAIGRAIGRVSGLLRDSQFLGAFRTLAEAIAGAIDALSKFFTSREQRNFFAQFALLAAHNLPLIVRIFENLVKLAERIGIAFAPVLTHILGGVGGFLGGQAAKANQPANAPAGFQQTKLGAFAGKSEGYLDDLTHFIGALFKFLGTVISIAAGAGDKGKNSLELMADGLNRWSKALENNKGGAREFFDNAIRTSGRLITLFGKLIKVFFALSQSKLFDDFLDLASGPILSALQDAGKLIGAFYSIVFKLSKVPGFGALLEMLASFYLFSKLTPAGMIARSIWHSLVLFYLRKIATGSTIGGIGRSLGGGGGRMGGAGAEGYEYGSRLGAFRSELNRLARRIPIVGGILSKAIPQFSTLGERLGLTGIKAVGLTTLLRLGLAGAVVLASWQLSKLIRRIPILGDALEGLGRSIGNAIYSIGSKAKSLLGLNPDTIHDHVTDSPVYEKGFQARYAALKKQHPKWSGAQILAEMKDEGFEKGGEIGGSGQGAATMIMAHVGEWVVNQKQQGLLSAITGTPVEALKSMLFGTPQKATSNHSSATRGKSGGQSSGLKHGLDSTGAAWYGYGPGIDDWGLTADAIPTYKVGGKTFDPNPVFIETPLGQWVNLARGSMDKIKSSKGMWIPEYVKRAQGFMGASRGQIQAWKRSHVMRGLGPGASASAIGRVMKSPMWSYGSGGVVGFQPSSMRMPSFAAGGVVSSPAVPTGSGRATRSTTQTFQIESHAPDIDIGYIMRVAKIHADSGS